MRAEAPQRARRAGVSPVAPGREDQAKANRVWCFPRSRSCSTSCRSSSPAYVLTPTVAAKNVVTLLFSLVFYAWGEPRFLLILLFSIAFNYLAAIADRRPARADAASGRWRSPSRSTSWCSACSNTPISSPRISPRCSKPLGLDFGRTNIELPLGISFFTFHCLSYIIDVYRRRFRANRDPVDVALYISLFPQLVAGPIVRYKTVARQLDKRRQTLGRASVGARIFIIGLAQKVLVADVVAPLVSVAFDHVPHRTMPEAWIGLLAYTIQIYFDFAGYSNMAIGLGIVLGFTFPRNFNLPYTSLSITEFWRRWHMSLSSWLRDYLYIPLGGNRGADLKTYRNLVTVFVLCGVWHGANWTFVLWGVWHGAFLVVERLGLKARLARLPVALRWALRAPRGHGRLGAVPLRRPRDRGRLFREPRRLQRLERGQLRHARRAERRAIDHAGHRLPLAVLPRFGCALAAPRVLKAAADAGWTFALLSFP